MINNDVNVLKLPGGMVDDLKPGTSCLVAGWGQTSKEFTSDTLQEVTIEVIDRKTCNSEDYYNHNPEVTQNMICAGDNEGRGDSCAVSVLCSIVISKMTIKLSECVQKPK